MRPVELHRDVLFFIDVLQLLNESFIFCTFEFSISLESRLLTPEEKSVDPIVADPAFLVRSEELPLP
jgi:hypothetical protein